MQNQIVDNLVFLKVLMPVYRKQSSNEKIGELLTTLCASLLELPQKTGGSNAMITQWVFTNIGELLDVEKEDALEFEMVLSIVQKILELSPFEKDPILTPAWIQAVSYGFCRISEFVLSAEVGGDNASAELLKFSKEDYPTFFAAFFTNSLAKFIATAEVLKPIISSSATTMLELLSRQCISNTMVMDCPQILVGIMNLVSDGISNINLRENWGNILKICSALFWRIGQQQPSLIEPLLEKLIYYRDDRSYIKSYPAKAEMDEALSAAVNSIGIGRFCEIIPLNIETQSDDQIKRPYLLSMFNDALEAPWLKSGWVANDLFGQQSLGYFATNLIPLANRMLEKSGLCWNEGKQVESKVYETLGIQIWDLFPKLCKLVPNDIPESFDFIAPTLGKILTLQPSEMYPNLPSNHDFRPLVCKGLEFLIDGFQKEVSTGTNDEEINKSLEKINHYSKRFLTALCNIYTSVNVANSKENTSKGQNLQTLNEALTQFYERPIKKFLEIAEEKSVVDYFVTLVAAETESSTRIETRTRLVLYSMVELSTIFLSYLPNNAESLAPTKSFYDLCLSFLKIKDGTLQKKSYKALNVLLQRQLFTNVGSLCESILETDIVEKISPGATKPRIRLVQTTIDLSNDPAFLINFVPKMLPEVMLTTKEANEKTRDSAYTCLIAMARKMMSGTDEKLVENQNQDLATTLSQFNMQEDGETEHIGEISIKEFCIMVCAGLSSESSNMQSAAIACLGRLLFEFSSILFPNLDALERQTIDEFIVTVLESFGLQNREVTKAALGFLKVAIICTEKQVIKGHLNDIVLLILK